MLDIDAMVDAMLASDASDFGPLAGVYREHGLRLPTVHLEARDGDIVFDEQRRLLRWWHELAAGGLPPPARIEPTELRQHLGKLTLVAPTGDGDFVYRLHGSRIADATGYELTGRRVSEGPRDGSVPAPILAYFTAVYRIVQARRQPLYARHPWRDIRGRPFAWHRLVLPFGDADAVTRQLVSNIPDSDAG